MAASNVNVVVITGNLTKDPELRSTGGPGDRGDRGPREDREDREPAAAAEPAGE